MDYSGFTKQQLMDMVRYQNGRIDRAESALAQLSPSDPRWGSALERRDQHQARLNDLLAAWLLVKE